MRNCVAAVEDTPMRSLLLAPLLFVLTLSPGAGNAGSGPLPQVLVSESDDAKGVNPNSETYRGYYLALSEIAGRKDFTPVADALRHQLDIVESVGLSPHVLQFFRSIPIVADEAACMDTPLIADMPGRPLACYGPSAPDRPKSSHRKPREPTVWDGEKAQWTNPDPVDLAEETRRGVVMVRPPMLDPQRPVILHELLHAYHAHMMPQGIQNPGILLYYKAAKAQQLYPDGSYLLTNEKEFFAVTASVFLYGKDGPITRQSIKEKQPDYFKYLVWLFGFDPAPAPGATPVASAY
jgi:hypothetical protein